MRRLGSLSLIAAGSFVALAGVSVYLASPASIVPYLGSSLSSLPGSSGRYTVSVSGISTPVFSYSGYSFTWFAFSGTAKVAITYSAPITGYKLSPLRLAIPSTVSGSTVTFNLTSPGKLCLKQVNGTTDYLYIVADPLETGVPPSAGPGIYNAVTDYAADSNYRESASAALNSAISAANSAGGGIVYVPSGHYRIDSSIHLQSNVSLYLAAGALLQVPAGFPCCFHNSSVIYTENATNVKIYGRGVIYGNGTSQPNAFFWLYSSEAETNARIEGVMFLDSQTTGVRLQDVGVTVENAKIISLPGRLADGIDLESASNVVIDNDLVLSTDDNVAFGAGTDTWRVIHPSDNITVTNTLFANVMTGHTMSLVPHKGIPGSSYMRNITYNNDDSIDTDAGFAIYPFGGTNIYNVNINNIGIENSRTSNFQVWANDCTDWGPGNCGTTDTGASKSGYVSNVNLTNVFWGNFPVHDSELSVSQAGSYIDGIHFINDVVAGAPIISASSMHLNFTGGPITNVTFSNTSLPQPI